MARLLASTPWFHGSIDAFDASPEMLAEFAQWVSIESPGAVAIQLTESTIESVALSPAPIYDVVALLECSEFLRDPPRAIARVTKPLRAGGLLLLTKPPWWLAWMFPGRTQRWGPLQRVLKSLDFDQIRICRWNWRYDVVTAWKCGSQLAKI
jgi:hypothetical protein